MGSRRTLGIPVPWVFTIAYLVGVGAQFAAPVSASGVLLLASVAVAVLLIVAGTVLASWGQALFRRARTTTVPGETSSALVTSGPYGVTRNPMYVGLFAVFEGVSLAFTLVWSMVLMLPVFYYLNWFVVPLEEERLAGSFGAEYEAYRKKVRRWL